MDNHQERKAKVMRAHLEQKAKERTTIEGYRTGSRIVLEELPVIDPFIRKLFLSWISKAAAREDKIVRSAYGDKIKVTIDASREIILSSTDGNLIMPAVTLDFLDEEGRIR